MNLCIQAHWGIGRLLLKYGQATEALPFFQKSVKYGKKFKSKQDITDYALSIMLLDYGVCLGENEKFEKQARAFNQSLRLRYRSSDSRQPPVKFRAP